jgi:hypothetical protein
MPIFPDCYDQWSLCFYEGRAIETVFEGTEEECRDYAHENFSYEEYSKMFLMDWEAREWDV